MSDINPTIGRVVHFNPTMSHAENLGMVYRCQGTPMDAHIVYVWPSGLVNLAVFDHDGIQHAVTSVKLLQDVSQAPLNAQGQLVESYCTWMPYQKGQAAKTEQAEKAAQALGNRAGCGKCIGQCQGHQTLAGAAGSLAEPAKQISSADHTYYPPVRVERTAGLLAMTDTALRDELKKPIAAIYIDMEEFHRQGRGAHFGLFPLTERQERILSEPYSQEDAIKEVLKVDGVTIYGESRPGEAHMVRLLLEKGSIVKVNDIPLLLDHDVVVRTHPNNVPLAFPEQQACKSDSSS